MTTSCTLYPLLSVVVPVYNERATIEEILWRIQAVDIEKEIVVVDDASTDGTREFLTGLATNVCSVPARLAARAAAASPLATSQQRNGLSADNRLTSQRQASVSTVGNFPAPIPDPAALSRIRDREDPAGVGGGEQDPSEDSVPSRPSHQNFSLAPLGERVASVASRVRGPRSVVDDNYTAHQPSAPVRTDQIRIFFQDRNCGKGAALRRGFKEARGQIVIVQDADLEYDPQDYFALIEPIQRGQADIVYGSRFLGGPHRVLLFWHYVGNKLLTTLSDMLTDLNLSDVWTCYKAFRREVLEQIEIQEDRFGFEQEITVKISKNSWRVYEVPISYFGRSYSEGKKITWKDGFRGLWCILRYSFQTRRGSQQKAQNPS